MRKNSPLMSRTIASHIRLTLIALGLLLLAGLSTPAVAQMAGGASNPELQQKIAALKQSAAENKQRLHHYQWVETQQITLKGEQKPQKVFQCSYGPNGQVMHSHGPPGGSVPAACTGPPANARPPGQQA